MNPNDLYQKLITAGNDYADKEHAASLLEGALKSIKAKIAIQYKDSGCGVAEADMRAEDDWEYKQAFQAKADARREAMKAKVHYDSVRVWVDIWRTVQASERAAHQFQT